MPFVNAGPSVTTTAQQAAALSGAANPNVWGPLVNTGAAIVAPANDTNENALVTVQLAPGQLGPNSRIKIRYNTTCTNSVNVKTLRVRLGGLSGTVLYSAVLTSLAGGFGEVEIVANNATNAQTGYGVQYDATPAIKFAANATSTIDTTVATSLVFTAQKATGTETITLVSCTVEHLYA